jgi:hypothetical protein
MKSTHFCRALLGTADEIFAEALEILEEEMAHLQTVRDRLKELDDSLHNPSWFFVI